MEPTWDKGRVLQSQGPLSRARLAQHASALLSVRQKFKKSNARSSAPPCRLHLCGNLRQLLPQRRWQNLPHSERGNEKARRQTALSQLQSAGSERREVSVKGQCLKSVESQCMGMCLLIQTRWLSVPVEF